MWHLDSEGNEEKVPAGKSSAGKENVHKGTEGDKNFGGTKGPRDWKTTGVWSKGSKWYGLERQWRRLWLNCLGLHPGSRI